MVVIPFLRRPALEQSGAGLSVKLSKEIIHKPMIEAVSRALDLENKGLNRAFGTSDFMEALTARMGKRDPQFSGS